MVESNELYLMVLPIIHLNKPIVEQTLSLFPDRKFATEFFSDDVDTYIALFTARVQESCTGGHVRGWSAVKEEVGHGRFIVRVIQHLQ